MILDLQSAWRELTERFREIRYFSSTMACDWWIWLSWLCMIGCFPELSDYSQLSDYNWTEWSMKNKTAYAPIISEFGKATRSKSFHVRYTWFNDQTIMRKFYCYLLFYCALKTRFHKMFYFSILFSTLFSIMFSFPFVNFMFYSGFHPWDCGIVPFYFHASW